MQRYRIVGRIDADHAGTFCQWSDVQADRRKTAHLLETSLAFCRVLLDVVQRDPLQLPHNDLVVHIAEIKAELARIKENA